MGAAAWRVMGNSEAGPSQVVVDIRPLSYATQPPLKLIWISVSGVPDNT
jgi:hypothetical protein